MCLSYTKSATDRTQTCIKRFEISFSNTDHVLQVTIRLAMNLIESLLLKLLYPWENPIWSHLSSLLLCPVYSYRLDTLLLQHYSLGL